jgi:hypothetical protein
MEVISFVPGCFTIGLMLLLPFKQKAVWAPDAVWTLWPFQEANHSSTDVGTAKPCQNNTFVLPAPWAGWCSWYSIWLWARRSGDRIPVGARFSAPVQTDPGAHPASCTMGTGSFTEVKSKQGMMLTPHPLLVP